MFVQEAQLMQQRGAFKYITCFFLMFVLTDKSRN